MASVPDSLLQTPWVERLSGHVRTELGYEIPPHRLVREIVPFTVAEAEMRGLAQPSDLIEGLLRGAEPAFWERLVDLTTIGETYFFRHPDQIEALTAWAVRAHRALGRPLEVWSAGCATGEEPYSVAMRFEAARVPCRITASDLSRAALARAEARGPYSDRSAGHLPEAYRERWLRADGDARWHLRDAGFPPIRFLRHNLVREAPLRPQRGLWDVILCRNVAIYFTREDTRRVLAALGSALDASGSLWVAPCDVVEAEAGGLSWRYEGGQRHLERETTSGVPPGRGIEPARVAPPAPVAASPSTAWVDALRAHLARGLYGGASDVIRRRLGAQADDGTAWVARAALLLRDHDFEDALEALARAADAHPRPEGLAYLRGVALLKMGRLDDALGSFLEAVRDDPDDWASSWQAAQLYRRRGRHLPEEAMLLRTEELLGAEEPASPAFGPAAHVVNSVHREGRTVRRLVRERLQALKCPGREELDT